MWIPDLDGRNPVRYLAIVEALAEAIAGGALRPGDRLPTHRDLAWTLGVNVSTVTQAYREAARRHLVAGEVGRGTYVLADSREATLFALGGEAVETMVDLSTNRPALDPDDTDLADALRGLLDGPGAAALQGYPAPALLRRAQVAGAAWLARRGLELRPASVVPCAGAQQALLAALLALCRPGDPVLVEEVTFPGIRAVARQLDLRLVGVAMDGEGVLPEALERAARASGARVAVLVPVLQNPTGAVMGHARRAEVAEAAGRSGLTLVEDDVYGGLADMPPLAALCPGRAVLVSSLSKTVAPGLRFGFVAGGAPAMSAVASETHATVWQMSPIALELGCRWIEDGTAFARSGRQRAEVEARWRLALGVLGRPAGRGQPSPHLWLPVQGCPEAAAERCRAEGAEVAPGTLFAAGRERPPFLRASLTTPPTRRDLGLGLGRVARALRAA